MTPDATARGKWRQEPMHLIALEIPITKNGQPQKLTESPRSTEVFR